MSTSAQPQALPPGSLFHDVVDVLRALPTDEMIDATEAAIGNRMPAFARLSGPEQYRIAHMALAAGMGVMTIRQQRAMSDVDRTIAALEHIIRKVCLHEWIIFTAYSERGPESALGYQVNVRDVPSRSALSQTYSALPCSFGRTPVEAGLRALAIDAHAGAAEVDHG